MATERTFRERYLIDDYTVDEHLKAIRTLLLTGSCAAVWDLVRTIHGSRPQPTDDASYRARMESVLLQYQIPGERATNLLKLAQRAAWWLVPVGRDGLPEFDLTIDLEEILTTLVYEDGSRLAYAEHVVDSAELGGYYQPRSHENRQGFCYDTLIALVEQGPLHDGDVPSKGGRDGLVAIGCAYRGLCDGEEGYNYATSLGVQLYMRALNLPPEQAHYPLHEAIAHRKAQHALRKMQSDSPKERE